MLFHEISRSVRGEVVRTMPLVCDIAAIQALGLVKR